MSDRTLRQITIAVAFIWLALQIIIVGYYSCLPQTSDADVYLSLAEKMAAADSWYPAASQIEGIGCLTCYIIYPGYINFLILIIHLFGPQTAPFAANIVFNVILAASIWRIAQKLGGRRVADMTIILYFICHYGILPVAMTLSDLPSLSLAMGAVALSTLRFKGNFFLSGIVSALAYYFRPSALLIAFALIAYLIVRRNSIRKLYLLTGGILAGCACILIFNMHVSGGYKFLSSNTMGVNMYIGANDEATGTYGLKHDLEFDTSLLKYDSFQCDSAYKRQALNWILDNKTEWMLLGVKKLKYQFTTHDMIYLSRRDGNPIVTSGNKAWKPLVIFWLWYPKIYDILLYSFAIYGLYMTRRRIGNGLWPVLIPVLGTLALCILTHGANRYNFTMLPVIMFFAGTALNRLTKSHAERQ